MRWRVGDIRRDESSHEPCDYKVKKKKKKKKKKEKKK